MSDFPYMMANHWVQWYRANNLLDPAGKLRSAEVMVEVSIHSAKNNPALLVMDPRGTMVLKARLVDMVLTTQLQTAVMSELQGVTTYEDLNIRVARVMERMRKSLQSGVLRTAADATATPVAFGYTPGGSATK